MSARLSRRSLLIGAAAAPLAACERARSTPTPTPSWPRTTDYEGVSMIELFPHEADQRSPLIVAIHGRGDRPDRWVEDLRQFPAKAQIALPRAFDAFGDGFSWFELTGEPGIGPAVEAAEARLWKGVAALAGMRKVIVTGFSQGGILSFSMAARHPDAVRSAFPVAGACPMSLWPQSGGRVAKVHALHGTKDAVLPIQAARDAVKAFKDQGNEAELVEYEGVGHQITRAMHDDLWKELVRALG